MSLSERDHAFRGAVSVNNLAVLHLERGNYGPAIEALQGGMKLMKFVLEWNDRSDDHCVENFAATAPRRIESDPIAEPSRWYLVPNLDAARSASRTQVLPLVCTSSFEGDPIAWDLPYLPSASQTFPIRLEDSCCCCSSLSSGAGASSSPHLQDDADLASSVLLYNLGLANLLESRQESSPSRAVRHLNFARSLLEMSFHVMCAVAAAAVPPDDELDGCCVGGVRGLRAEALPFALVLVHAKYQVLSGLGDAEGAQVAFLDYRRILHQHCEHSGRSGWLDAFSSSAAAAA